MWISCYCEYADLGPCVGEPDTLGVGVTSDSWAVIDGRHRAARCPALGARRSWCPTLLVPDPLPASGPGILSADDWEV
jgi:hypothetical protein